MQKSRKVQVCGVWFVLWATASGSVADSIAFYRALDLEGVGKYREAAALFRQALHTTTGVSALLGLERAYAELQWSDSLLAPLDTLIRDNPREPIFRAAQLRTLQTLGRDADVRDAFERWVNDAPRNADPYREYARLLLQRGQAQRADSVLSRARIQLGGTGDIQLEIAQTRAATGQWEESARAWRAALVNAPYLEQAAASTALVLLHDQGRVPEGAALVVTTAAQTVGAGAPQRAPVTRAADPSARPPTLRSSGTRRR